MGLEVRCGFKSLLDSSQYNLGQITLLFSIDSVRIKSVHTLLFLLALNISSFSLPFIPQRLPNTPKGRTEQTPHSVLFIEKLLKHIKL